MREYETADGDVFMVEEQRDGWYWRWASPYAPDEDWHGPFSTVEAAIEAV